MIASPYRCSAVVAALVALLGVLLVLALRRDDGEATVLDQRASAPATPRAGDRPGSLAERLVAGALERLRHHVTYDGSYRRIAYPNGDVPDDIGVCTDVVIRAYRAAGVDLQQLVHEDMTEAFDEYPHLRGLDHPDANIDHRRVPNLRRFFERHGASLPVTMDPDDYRPGDLVTWMLPGNLPHIGIAADARSADGRRPLIVHNIGEDPAREDVLFAFPITGHYRYAGPHGHQP